VFSSRARDGLEPPSVKAVSNALLRRAWRGLIPGIGRVRGLGRKPAWCLIKRAEAPLSQVLVGARVWREGILGTRGTLSKRAYRQVPMPCSAAAAYAYANAAAHACLKMRIKEGPHN